MLINRLIVNMRFLFAPGRMESAHLRERLLSLVGQTIPAGFSAQGLSCATISAVTANFASHPSECDTAMLGWIFIQSALVTINGSGAITQTASASLSATGIASKPSFTQTNAKAAQVIAPIVVESAILFPSG